MNIHQKICALLVIPMLFITCKKSDHSLGTAVDKSQITYSVTQDLTVDPGGNTVIIKNTTPATLSYWDYEIGTSHRAVDTVKFAFAGDHVVKLIVSTGGKLLKMDSVVVKVTANNLAYVTGELWGNLTGGVGHEKSWVLDTEGKSFNGPIYFYGTNNGWLLGGDKGCYGGDCWAWEAGIGSVYPGIMAQGDYGVMTFGLINTLAFTAVKPMEGGITQTGTYFLNDKTHMLTINNASILRGYKPAKNGITGISNWTNYTILSLTESKMQLGVFRDNDVDGESKCMLVYNFIVKP